MPSPWICFPIDSAETADAVLERARPPVPALRARRAPDAVPSALVVPGPRDGDRRPSPR